ncbi:hypothetical protein ABZY09_01320 [Streptomyces sp. NPDC002928]|uniref:hypothetical protein n=1 Tax=Streptomyces sp. NPDC002928 TaxID=3154440 RepID=UPI0033B29CBB
MDLAPLRDPQFVEYVVVEALRPADHTTRLSRETPLAILAERQFLLVLDGFEHLMEACAALVSDLLRRAPGLTVLATGRRPLRGGGRAPPAGPAGLFVGRAAQQGPAVGDDEDVREPCRRLDGIPTAIEPTAGRPRCRHHDWCMGLAIWCELNWFSSRQNEVAARIEAEGTGVAADLPGRRGLPLPGPASC